MDTGSVITKYECTDCQDTEILLTFGSPNGRWCHCREWKQAKRMLQKSGIEEEFQRITFADYQTKDKHPLFHIALQRAKEYASVALQDYKDRTADEPKRTKYNGMGLCGEPGSGKTTLLLATGNALLKRRVPVLYFQHREEFDRLKAFNFDGSGELYERLKTFNGVLLWDDLFKTARRDESGHRRIADWEADASWAVLNYRVFKDLPVAFSTEWSPTELINQDRSTAGRLLERCKHQDPKKDRLVWFRITQKEREAGLDPIKTFDHRFMREQE